MKKSLYKCCAKGFIYSLLFVAAATSLFASKYNEPRKVLYSKQKNALYKNLTVTGDMRLDTKANDNRTFLMEIGKRPTFFWKNAVALHPLQSQTLTFNNFTYNEIADDIFKVNKIDAQEGLFLSDGGMFVKTAELWNGTTGIIAGLQKNLGIHLQFISIGTTFIDYYTNSLNIIKAAGADNPTTANTPTINILDTRDLTYNGVNFVSPRMVIALNTNNSSYTAIGTAKANFQLANLNLHTAGEEMKSYYGDWEVDHVGACQIFHDDDHGQIACRKYYKSKSGIPDPQGYDSSTGIVWDIDTTAFTCANKPKTDPVEVGTLYDFTPDGVIPPTIFLHGYFCYDYLTTNSGEVYNYPKDPYEFKVQEVFRLMKDKEPVLISQTPRLRTTTSNNVTVEYPVSQDLDPTKPWSIWDNSNISDYTFNVNTSSITNLSELNVIANSDQHPCFTICNGTYCESNRLYIRDNRRIRLIQDAALQLDSNTVTKWPIESEKSPNRLAIVEYTVGVCPAITKSGANSDVSVYTAHEANFVPNLNGTVMIDGIMIKLLGKDFSAPDVCLRRKVACNKLDSSETYKSRSYKPFTTDY